MTSDTPALLTHLRALQPDVRNAQRVRARCRTRLERDNRRSQHWTTATRVIRESATSLLAAGLCMFYAAELVKIAARVFTI